jgi:threonine dehydrogenase-like Zn-dependent dehydrogenase
VGVDANAHVTVWGKGAVGLLFASLAALREIFRDRIAHVLHFSRFF